MLPPLGTDFTAAPSALGYFYQVRYALVVLLQAANPESVISIEKLDDIAFEEEGEPVQLLQTKHHVTHTGSLTDSSSDLWKTLRVWAVSARGGLFDLDSVILSLVTTASSPTDSAAALLRSGTGRNVSAALDKLRKAGQVSTSGTVKQAFGDFQTLSSLEQEKLVSCVRVLDNAPDIIGARELLEDRLRYSTRQQFLSGLCDRLEGWWFSRAVEHLKHPDSIKGISQRLVQVQINDLAEQFRLDNLPIDFPFPIDLDESDLSSDERIFVEQLKLVLVGNQRIKRAISDYYRAFQQRSKWVREDLLLDRELEIYETRLVNEWEEVFLRTKENLAEDSDHAVVGRELYNNIIDMPRHIPIRPSFPDPFVMRGSFHILANSLKVGWHPQFRERLTHALETAMKSVA
jgi:hypothetical protein